MTSAGLDKGLFFSFSETVSLALAIPCGLLLADQPAEYSPAEDEQEASEKRYQTGTQERVPMSVSEAIVCRSGSPARRFWKLLRRPVNGRAFHLIHHFISDNF